MRQILYTQSSFGKFTNQETLDFLEQDQVGAEWLQQVSAQLVHDMKLLGAKEFGIESAKEVIVAAINKGFFVPEFCRPERI